jgi:FAD/FMN-containing dehydrogenase
LAKTRIIPEAAAFSALHKRRFASLRGTPGTTDGTLASRLSVALETNACGRRPGRPRNWTPAAATGTLALPPHPPRTMTDPRLAGLVQTLPDLRLLTDPADLEHYGRDWTRRWTPAPLAIALPATVDEVQAIVRWARGTGVGIVPSGGRTGLSGGAVAANGELVVSLERMNRVLGFDPVDRTLTVQAGMPLEAVQNAAREHGLAYPVDFASRGSCTIGGNIATNAGGIRVIRYGNTREWVAGLKLVDGRGELLDLGRGLVKNSSGYDLRHLAVASEGTLGIIVEATLRLADPPPPTSVMLLALPDFEALMQVFSTLRARLRLEAFEFLTDRALDHVVAHGAQPPFAETYPFYVVTEFATGEAEEAAALEAFEYCVGEGWVVDGVISQSEAQAAQLWRLREGITESVARYVPYKNDVSVRISAMPAFLAETQALLAREYPHFEVVWFGHIGDGNLHINVLKPDDTSDAEFVSQCETVTKLLAESLQRHGGSISAEHGIGLVKKPYLSSTRSAAEIDLMRGIRRVLDPDGLMNPGKLFDP